MPLTPDKLDELRRLVYDATVYELAEVDKLDEPTKLVYDATVYELAEVIFKEHRDEELVHLIKLIQTRVEESNED